MIHQKIQAFFGTFNGSRYRSWEHCYRFFRDVGPSGITAQPDQAALQLGFYLASWGMYRRSFLLQHDYTVHLPIVACLASSRFAPLWDREFGSEANDFELVPVILDARDAVIEAYSEFGQATPTLVTKVLLGTFACLPALDKYSSLGSGMKGGGIRN
jgi:hypothetical protein